MHVQIDNWQEWIALVAFLAGTVLFFVWVLRLWLKK
jgi:hypothetical protein